MASLFRRPSWLGRAWKPLTFSKSNFKQIAPDAKLEEERIYDDVSRYYPAHLGEILKNRYQIVGKLGFGVSSTVWFARDLRFDASPRKSDLGNLYANRRTAVVVT